MFIPRLIIFFLISGFFAALVPFCLVGFAFLTPNYLYWYNNEFEYYPHKAKYTYKKKIFISTLLMLVGVVLFPLCLIPGNIYLQTL